MLETGSRGQAGGLLQLAHQLPGVKGVQEVDIAGTAVQHLDGQLPLLHVDAGWLLVGVATVLQFKFFHIICVSLLRSSPRDHYHRRGMPHRADARKHHRNTEELPAQSGCKVNELFLKSVRSNILFSSHAERHTYHGPQASKAATRTDKRHKTPVPNAQKPPSRAIMSAKTTTFAQASPHKGCRATSY